MKLPLGHIFARISLIFHIDTDHSLLMQTAFLHIILYYTSFKYKYNYGRPIIHSPFHIICICRYMLLSKYLNFSKLEVQNQFRIKIALQTFSSNSKMRKNLESKIKEPESMKHQQDPKVNQKNLTHISVIIHNCQKVVNKNSKRSYPWPL